MDLNSLIPNNNENWVVSKNFLFFKFYERIPICFIENDIVYIFLDSKAPRQILCLVKSLSIKGIDFYFTTPELSEPNRIYEEDYNRKVIRQYLLAYSNSDFFDGFKSIDFDLISNMVRWVDKVGCFDIVKLEYEKVISIIDKKYYDHYADKYIFEYDDDMREEFRTLYRDIQIGRLL